MIKTQTIDMTQGNPTKLLVTFALPMLIGSIFQLMYNMTDSVILGKFVGADALASIGATSSTTFLFLALATGMTGGITIVISQYFGAKNDVLIRRTTVSAIYITISAAVLLGIVGFFAARPVMQLLGTPDNIIDQAVIYVQITCGLYVTQIAYNSAASILRALGDSKTPLYFLIICTMLNVVLDLIFVVSFHNGVAGVAFATVISQAVSAVLCIVYMAKKYTLLHFKKEDMKPDWKLIRRIMSIGLPMGLQSCLLSIGMMVITSVINSFGSDVVAAQTVGSKVEQLVTIIFSQVAFSFSVYSGQNFGAKDFMRIKLGLKKAFIIVGSLSLISTAVMFLFGKHIILLFVDPSETMIIKSAGELIHIEALFFAALGWIWLYNSALRGIGDMGVTLLSSLVELGAKILLSIFLSRAFGYIGIWYAAPIGWVLGLIPSMIRFHSGGWKRLADKM
jgi:putative MATE family efflux protein